MFFREEERNLYKTSLNTLASSRKLRPVFVQKKSVTDQIKWIHESLKYKQNVEIGEHLLQVWFMQAKSELLVVACDNLGITHNGEGYVEGNLPETLEDEKLDNTISALLEQFGAPLTTLYLYIFNLQIPGGWENLTEKLSSDERLGF